MDLDIDMKELEAFVCVVEKGNFSRAAKTLYLAQPTVSAHVASLERKLGIRLLVRTAREIYPSEAGKLVFGYAKDILSLRGKIVGTVKSFSSEMRGTIDLAASTIPGQYHLPKIIQGFHEIYPDISFNLRQLNSSEVVEQITSHKVELGFTGSLIPSNRCVYQELTGDNLVVITPNTPQYQGYLATGFPIQQLKKESFISRERGSGSRIETENFLKEMGVKPSDIHTVVEVRSIDSIKLMVSMGLGISILSQSACRDYCQFKKLLAFNFDKVSLRRKLYLVRQKKNILSPIAQAFYNYAADFYKDESEKGLPENTNKKHQYIK